MYQVNICIHHSLLFYLILVYMKYTLRNPVDNQNNKYRYKVCSFLHTIRYLFGICRYHYQLFYFQYYHKLYNNLDWYPDKSNILNHNKSIYMCHLIVMQTMINKLSNKFLLCLIRYN